MATLDSSIPVAANPKRACAVRLVILQARKWATPRYTFTGNDCIEFKTND
jgi:hypothetical protein